MYEYGSLPCMLGLLFESIGGSNGNSFGLFVLVRIISMYPFTCKCKFVGLLLLLLPSIKVA